MEMDVGLLVLVLLYTSTLCTGQSPFNFKCKPKLGCDFSKCDPIPEELVGMEGFDVELYRKQNNYHITCSPVAPIGFIKGIKGDTGSKGEPGNFGRSINNAVAAKGDKGERGDEGRAGIPGVAGQKGEKGETGSDMRGKVVKGSKGDKGLRGFRGFKGDKGSSGSGNSVVLMSAEIEKAKKARKDLEAMIQEEKTKRTELEKRLLSAEGKIKRIEKRIDEKFQQLTKKMSEEITQKLLEFVKPQKSSTVTTESTTTQSTETPWWFSTAETTTTPTVETPWSPTAEETTESHTPTTKNPQHEKCAYVDGKRCFLPLNNEIGYYSHANRRCENAGGGLADIRNEKELNAIMDYVRKHGMEWENKLEFYVGMTYFPQTKEVYLRNGSIAPFVLWHPTYPRTYGDKMTLVIRKSPYDGWQYFTNTDGGRMAQPLCLILLN